MVNTPHDPQHSNNQYASDGAQSAETNSISEQESLGKSLSASLGGNIRRTESGHVDVLHAIGGWRGLVETSLPSLLFLIFFTVTKDLNLALVIAIAAAGIFTMLRLIQRSKLIPAVSGIVGVAICAFTAFRTGNAADYYLPGFWTNGIYSVAFIVSIIVGWPLAGLIFGYIRGEQLTWRQKPKRLKAYKLATWIMAAVLLLRLAIQIPLYYMNATEVLGAMRIVMGLPLYAAGIWLAWRVSDPAETS